MVSKLQLRQITLAQANQIFKKLAEDKFTEIWDEIQW